MKLKTLKMNTISLEMKIAILNRIAEDEGSVALGKEFGSGEFTTRAIQKRAGVFHEENFEIPLRHDAALKSPEETPSNRSTTVNMVYRAN
ncbi:hypothetical protein WN51_11295 [Melipona quadrifasciata]|uniref:HTH psq-type domain-containing protein n=1 Tax=Melipona quadrifasciata TaxID=166423 RepID=A0A0M9A472_9HYME|nr:hypothetical protein WN51_11295 [Melipona quadrifasciata]